MNQEDNNKLETRAELYQSQNKSFAHWAKGYGPIQHSFESQVRVFELAQRLCLENRDKKGGKTLESIFEILSAADRISAFGMWLVVNMTYVRSVHLDGRRLEAQDFKETPEGHTGGSLNMVPAYVGYLTANSLCGNTRSWIMGQGHCVAAIDAVNLIVDNMSPAHAERYALSDHQLSRFTQDFYSYKLTPSGRPESPLGSHVNAHTAGGLIEGGYLGFAELYYPHMPLPGEELVTFLSDGAFEEQKGGDWAPRWWRAKDCGNLIPVMIANGRRIDQRTTMSQQGGVPWLRKHLTLNNFEPVDIDGRDPAAFAWAIIEASETYDRWRTADKEHQVEYPCRLPYAIAESEKGFGFPGADTNAAHNLPLGSNPRTDKPARDRFNEALKNLWVEEGELRDSVAYLNNHTVQNRVKERDHALTKRSVAPLDLPQPQWKNGPGQDEQIPIHGIDQYFCDVIKANSKLRVRVGNPDELSSNQMQQTLNLLKHRVTAPEPGIAEDLNGSVITVLNEEAVVAAALANKGGINAVVSYEAFAVKMLGAIRQELIFVRHQKEAGIYPGWLSVPIILTSHTWENGKNEQSHQDPTLCEALLGEMSDVSRVVFPADWNSAAATLHQMFQTREQIWTMVVPKRNLPQFFTKEQSQKLACDGGIVFLEEESPAVILTAVGAYQLVEVIKAARWLKEKGIAAKVVYLLEPGRFREGRDESERKVLATRNVINDLYPKSIASRVFLVHGHPEAFLGTFRPLDTGPKSTQALGYINRGGTLDTFGMLFANGSTWGHVVVAAAECLEENPEEILGSRLWAAVKNQGSPTDVFK